MHCVRGIGQALRQQISEVRGRNQTRHPRAGEVEAHCAGSHSCFSGRAVDLIPETFYVIHAIDDKNCVMIKLSRQGSEECLSSGFLQLTVWPRAQIYQQSTGIGLQVSIPSYEFLGMCRVSSDIIKTSYFSPS